LAYGNTELLQRISDVQARLARIVILSSNGTSHARSGQWTNAIGDFSELIRLDPNEQDYYHSMSALLARSGDVDGYRWHCAKILAVFGATNHPVFAERSAKDCLILPVAGIDLNAVARLADTAIKNGESHSYFAYFEFAKGLAEYRQGHFESAIEWMRKVLVEGSADYRDAETFLVLGMAQQRSGRLAEARAALAKSREIIETKFPKLESGDIGDYWVDWIIVDALLKEAKELIEEPRASSK
jgi:Flp pilus assembly protein TadD